MNVKGHCWNSVNKFVLTMSLLLSARSSSGSSWNGFVLPTFLETKTNITAFVGTTAILPCSVANLGTKKVVWKKVNQIYALTIGDFVFTSDSKFYIEHPDNSYDWNLVIKDITKSYAGQYDCQVSTKEDVYKRVTLTVKDAPPSDDTKGIRISGPNFTEKGDSIKIQCYVSSVDVNSEQIDWFHEGVRIQSSSFGGISITEQRNSDTKTVISTLMIYKSAMKHTGTFLCRNSKRDVVSHHVVVLNADSSHGKRGFQDKANKGSKEHYGNIGCSIYRREQFIWFCITLCLSLYMTNNSR